MTKTVFITGASSGIGKATARAFAARGWNVIATLRSPEQDRDLGLLDQVLVTRLDVQDPSSISSAVSAGLERFGAIDVLVNNAGYGQAGIFEAVSADKVREQFEVNVFGVMAVMRAVLPHFRRRKSGLILNVSSGGGIYGVPAMAVYSASKFALEGFCEAVSYELSSLGIGLKLIEPHGGVSDNAFNARAAKDATETKPPEEYQTFVEHMRETTTKQTAAITITSDDVATVIFGAATDGTDRLRYRVGNDTRGFLKAKDELSDADYMAFMRSKCLASHS
jgi:NAD(P)-dependent dehydrogenase (short-subunit alcohol dehydrogenase family)